MARLIDRIFFDRQDRDILVLVNRILEAPNVPSRDNLFNPELHPHGIKELVPGNGPDSSGSPVS